MTTGNPPEQPADGLRNEAPTQPPPPKETPPAAKVKASSLKKPSFFERVRYSLFSSETRMGRFIRAALRTLVAIVILAGLGALAVYVLLYLPAAKNFQAVQQAATQSAAAAEQSQTDLNQVRQSLSAAQTQAASAKTQVETAQAREQVLRALNSVLTARLAVSQNALTDAASALKAAQAALQPIQPQLDELDSKEFSTLQTLFTLANNDLNRDAKLAAQDLDRLQSELTRLDKLLSQ